MIQQSFSTTYSTCGWRNLLKLLQNWRHFKRHFVLTEHISNEPKFLLENSQPSQLSVEKERDAEGRTRLPTTCKPHWKHTQAPFRCFSTPETLRTQPALLVEDKISFIMNIKITISILHFSPTQRGIFSLWKKCLIQVKKDINFYIYIHTQCLCTFDILYNQGTSTSDNGTCRTFLLEI